MYTDRNFQTKKALKAAVAGGARIRVVQPGPFGKPVSAGQRVTLEGPHYPKPHTWYATATLGADGCIDKVN